MYIQFTRKTLVLMNVGLPIRPFITSHLTVHPFQVTTFPINHFGSAQEPLCPQSSAPLVVINRLRITRITRILTDYAQKLTSWALIHTYAQVTTYLYSTHSVVHSHHSSCVSFQPFFFLEFSRKSNWRQLLQWWSHTWMILQISLKKNGDFM